VKGRVCARALNATGKRKCVRADSARVISVLLCARTIVSDKNYKCSLHTGQSVHCASY
jgi:hypothetical protein